MGSPSVGAGPSPCGLPSTTGVMSLGSQLALGTECPPRACVIPHGSCSHLCWMGGVDWRPLGCLGPSLAGKGSPERREQPGRVLRCPSSASPSLGQEGGSKEHGRQEQLAYAHLPTPAGFWDAAVALCQPGLSPPGWHQVLGPPGQWDDPPLVPSSAPCASLSIPSWAGGSWGAEDELGGPRALVVLFMGCNANTPMHPTWDAGTGSRDTSWDLGGCSLGPPHPYRQIPVWGS